MTTASSHSATRLSGMALPASNVAPVLAATAFTRRYTLTKRFTDRGERPRIGRSSSMNARSSPSISMRSGWKSYGGGAGSPSCPTGPDGAGVSPADGSPDGPGSGAETRLASAADSSAPAGAGTAPARLVSRRLCAVEPIGRSQNGTWKIFSR